MLKILHLFPLVLDLSLLAHVLRHELSSYSRAACQRAAVVLVSLENMMFS